MRLYQWGLAIPRPLAERLHRTLSQEEQDRAERLASPDLRAAFVAGRAGLRQLPGVTLDRAPESLRFEYVANGKPQLIGAPSLHFNLAHSGGEALLAITSEPVGVDLERHRTIVNEAGLVERWFSATEQQRYNAAPLESRQSLFFRLWTGKEAVLKLHGGSVGEALRQIEPPAEAQQGRVEVADRADQACWVTRLGVEEGWSAAVATRTRPAETLRLWRIELPLSIGDA